MTISDDMHVKLSNVTEALGKERSQHDRTKTNLKILREDYDILAQRHRDLKRDMAQLKELQSQ